MKFYITIMILVIAGFFILPGCDIEEMIEDLTTRDITVDQIIATGTLKQNVKTAIFLENTTLNSEDRIETEINLSEMVDSISFFIEEQEPAGLFLEGKINNPTTETVRLILSIASVNESKETHFFASATLSPGEELEIDSSEGLDQAADQVTESLRDFFLENPELTNALIIAEAEGNSGDALIEVDTLTLTATVAYQEAQSIPGNLISGAGDNMKSISSVMLNGSIANRGESEFRFILYLGYKDQGPDYDHGLVADGYIDPNSNRHLKDMVVKEGLPRLKNALYRVVDGENIEWYLVFLGTDRIDTKMDRLAFEAEVTVGL